MLFIDRFESGSVICEDESKNKVILYQSEIPDGAKEGDMLIIDENGAWKVDFSASKRKKASLFLRLNRLSKRK